MIVWMERSALERRTEREKRILTNGSVTAEWCRMERTPGLRGTAGRNQRALKSAAVFPNPKKVLRVELHLRGGRPTRTSRGFRADKRENDRRPVVANGSSNRGDDGDPADSLPRHAGDFRKGSHCDDRRSRSRTAGSPKSDRHQARGRGHSARPARKKPSTM